MVRLLTMAKQVDYVDVRLTATGYAVDVAFSTTITTEDGWYLIACPSLEVYTQGETKAEAEKNINEAVSLFLETCIKDNSLAQQLEDLGFTKDTTSTNGNGIRKNGRTSAHYHEDTLTIDLSAAEINALKKTKQTLCGYFHA